MHSHHHHHHGACAHGFLHPQDTHRRHSHHGLPENLGKGFAWAAGINMAFVVAELTYGVLSNSVGLIADAAHNFSDVIGLLLAWGGAFLARLNPTAERTFGYSSASILAALGNAALLFVATGGIIFHSIHRFFEPEAVQTGTVMAVACLGILINGGTAMIFHKSQEHDLNARGAYLHMIADAAVSLGVIIAGFLISKTGWLWIDPLVGIVIAAVILVGTWGLAKDALHLSLAGVPKHVDRDGVFNFLKNLPGVTEVHDLHIWGMSTTQTALTAHLVMPEGLANDALLHGIAVELETRYGIQHPTLQVERGDDSEPCKFAPDQVI